jgi:hypothetical protein
MERISTFRLYLLRAVYLMLAAGGFTISWAAILDPAMHWELMHGVVVSMLGAMSLLALLGIRYPVRMLPLLLWEIAWKCIWLLRVALPLWRADQIDAATTANIYNCALVLIVVAAIPWPYVYAHYVKQRGDPWARGAARL